MPARPVDWSPLYDSDPIPGDPYDVTRLGKHLRDMASEIEKQSKNIRALSSVEGWDSEAGRKFNELAGDTAVRLGDVYDRYAEAAKALGTKVREGQSSEYATELHRAQRKADKALAEFREAEVEHKAALKALGKYEGSVPASAEESADRTRQTKRRDDAAREMGLCRRRIEEAKGIRDDAAKKAARKIKNIVHHDDVRDPGGLMNFLADYADIISAIASVVAVVALAAAAVLFSPIAAAALAMVAVAFSAAALTGRLYDYFARGGEFDALKIGLDVLGVIPGLGVLKGVTAAATGSRIAGAQKGIWTAFTNGLAVKGINKGVGVASKLLAKRGIAAPKLPSGGWQPEVVSRYIKGAGAISGGIRIFRTINEKSDSNQIPDSRVDSPGERPSYDPSNPAGPGSPPRDPNPSPRPSPAAFNRALAPSG